MVTCVDDIIGEITPISMFSAEQSTKSKKAGLPIRKRAPAPPEVTISADEAAILREVTGQGVQIDTVASRTGLDAAKVNSLLVALRLKGRVRFLPGNRVAT